jgi:hypothetical protein
VAWSSTNALVASVSATGTVTGLAAGTTAITATSEGITGSASLAVAVTPVASVAVTLGASSLTVGQTTQAAATLRDALGGALTDRLITWSSSNTSVATVSATGLVTAVGGGTASIRATSEGVTGSASLSVTAPLPPPPPGSEPIYTPGSNGQSFFDDFERYSDAASLKGGGWAITTGADPYLEFTAGSGNGGGKALGFHWTAGNGWLGAEHAMSSQPGRVGYVSWDYRAPDFQYVGASPAQQGIKFFIVNNGTSNRITIGLNTAVDIGMVQSNGVYLWVQPTLTPWGSQLATVQRLTDGGWHRLTLRRTKESSNGAMDGALELWIDGEKLFDLQRIGTGTMSIEEIMLAGTFNGGSPKDQREWYDNVRIWY